MFSFAAISAYSPNLPICPACINPTRAIVVFLAFLIAVSIASFAPKWPKFQWPLIVAVEEVSEIIVGSIVPL